MYLVNLDLLHVAILYLKVYMFNCIVVLLYCALHFDYLKKDGAIAKLFFYSRLKIIARNWGLWWMIY